MIVPVKRALVSVTDKSGLAEFAAGLDRLGIKILSTGGTGNVLVNAGIPFKEVSSVTGSPEIFGGRVKTLHPNILGAILYRRGNKSDEEERHKFGINTLDLVVVNLYDFKGRTSGKKISNQEAVEAIDIGGPSMIRAAAKNWSHVAVLVSPERYPEILKELQEKGGLDDSTRQELASEAFALTSNYDTLISQWFQSSIDSKKTTAKSEKVQGATKEKLPEQIRIDLKREQLMRYGENPHQAAAYYQMAGEEQFGLNACKQLHGKKLSFNNLIDADIALTLPLEFEEPCVAILKHTTPSGVAVADSLAEAEAGARACDPVSAFGGIIGMNRVCDEKTAKQISKAFTEVIVAPGYTPEALNILVKKKNQRILEIPPDIQLSTGWDMRRIGGGLLIQDQDTGFPELDELKVVTKRQPTEEEWKDIRFAWVIVKYVKSNAVLFAKNGKTLGMGAGQMSRVDAVRLACLKAEDANLDLAGSVLASDAFFPFPDGLEQAGNAGAKTVIQPGGSVRDQEVIDAADKMGIAMVLTGRRHFRHA